MLPLRMPYERCGGVQCTNADRKVSCIVCLESLKPAAVCSSGHAMCITCFEQYVSDVSSAASEKEITALSAEERRDFGRVQCPCRGIAGGCTSQPFSDAAVVKALLLATSATAPAVVEKYLEMKTLIRVTESTEKAFAEAQEALQVELANLKTGAPDAKGPESAGNHLLSRQLKKLMPNARQCKMCSYGPMDFRACSDLSAHHNQLVRSVAVGGDANNVREIRLDNACPRCGWFAKERKQWPRWNGTISTDELPAGATPFERSDRAAREWYPKVAAAEKIAEECRARAADLETELKAAESRLSAECHARQEAEASAMRTRAAITTSELACAASASKLLSQLERERALRRAAEQRARSALAPLTNSPRALPPIPTPAFG